MRELKFRGKCKEKDGWIYGSYVKSLSGSFIAVWDDFYDGYMFPVDPKSVGQAIDLFDAEGKEVYEGDIIETSEISKCCGITIRQETEIVAFKWQGFYRFSIYDADFEQPTGFANIKNEHCRVVGNVFDDPDMVKFLEDKLESTL